MMKMLVSVYGTSRAVAMLPYRRSFSRVNKTVGPRCQGKPYSTFASASDSDKAFLEVAPGENHVREPVSAVRRESNCADVIARRGPVRPCSLLRPVQGRSQGQATRLHPRRLRRLSEHARSARHQKDAQGTRCQGQGHLRRSDCE